MLSRNVIGGKRMVGTGYVACKVCGIHFRPGEPHPETEYVEEGCALPFYVKCPHVGEVVPELHEFCDSWEMYKWVRTAYEWR